MNQHEARLVVRMPAKLKRNIKFKCDKLDRAMEDVASAILADAVSKGEIYMLSLVKEYEETIKKEEV